MEGRRRVVGGALAGTVALCLLGVAIFHADGSPELLLQPAMPPQGGESKLYGFMPAPSPVYDRTLKGEAAYLGAIQNAHASTADLESVVNHYAGLPTSYFAGAGAHARLLDAVRGVDSAHRLWYGAHGSLQHLDRQIDSERKSLERMHVSQHVLKKRAELIKGEVSRLLASSKQVGRELDTLKGKYSTQVNEMRAQYADAAKALTAEREAAERELMANRKEQSLIAQEVAKATEKAAYFVTQAENLKEDVEAMRERARGWENQEKTSRASILESEDLKNQQIGQENDSKAHRAAARLEEGAIAEISKMRARADAVNTARASKAIRLGAEKAVQDSLKHAAEMALDSAVDMKDTEMRESARLQDMLGKLNEKIYEYKTDSTAANTQATENTLRMHEEKRVYDKLMHKLSYLERRFRQARDVVETAESKAAAITTEGKVSELKAQTAMALADQRKEQAEKLLKDGTAQYKENIKLAEEDEDNKESLMHETMDAIAQREDADSKASLEMSEARFRLHQGKALESAAKRKRDKAQALLDSVHRLAELAREAAEVAAAQKIRAKARSISARTLSSVSGGSMLRAVDGGDGVGNEPSGAGDAGVVTVNNPSVTVHVSPHAAGN
jgi:hypothetical protein